MGLPIDGRCQHSVTLGYGTNRIGYWLSLHKKSGKWCSGRRIWLGRAAVLGGLGSEDKSHCQVQGTFMPPANLASQLMTHSHNH